MPTEKADIIATIIWASIFMLVIVIAAFLLFRTYLKKKNFLRLEQERMKTVYEQTLLRSQLEIQEQTFAQISREIHDNIGQVLSLVRLNINTMGPEPVPDKIAFTDELLGKAITDLRTLSHNLDAKHIKRIGLTEAFMQLLNILSKTGKFKTSYTGHSVPDLDDEHSIILYRIVQEALNNIIKHSCATAVSIDVSDLDKGMAITIADNGKGFDTSTQSDGVGLKNMQDRAKVIGASVQIISKPGEGTNAIITLSKE